MFNSSTETSQYRFRASLALTVKRRPVKREYRPPYSCFTVPQSRAQISNHIWNCKTYYFTKRPTSQRFFIFYPLSSLSSSHLHRTCLPPDRRPPSARPLHPSARIRDGPRHGWATLQPLAPPPCRHSRASSQLAAPAAGRQELHQSLHRTAASPAPAPALAVYIVAAQKVSRAVPCPWKRRGKASGAHQEGTAGVNRDGRRPHCRNLADSGEFRAKARDEIS
jgi:hypothetical protein